MRHVDPPARPYGWQTHVLKKGRAWLNDDAADNRSAKRPSAFWLQYRDEIGAAFDYICCYTVVWVPNGEADHFVPWGDVRGTRKAHLAYQWSNIRYADGWVNRSKGADRFPDPFVVQDDWFELHLPSLELRSTVRVPPDQHDAVTNVLKRVRSDERVMKPRRRYLRQYLEGHCSIELVDENAPLLGRALRDNPAFLLPTDQARLEAGEL